MQNALDFVRDGDVFVVTKLDRLARSVVDLANIVQKFEVKNVDLVVLNQGIDTTSIYGRLQFNILAAIGEFERGIIRERSYEGRMRALARGVKFDAGARNFLVLYWVSPDPSEPILLLNIRIGGRVGSRACTACRDYQGDPC